MLAGDARIIGVEMAEYADSIETSVIASTTGVRSMGRETGCSLVAYSLAGDDDEVTTGFGFSVGRRPRRPRPRGRRQAGGRSGDPHVGCRPGSEPPPHGRVRPVGDGAVPVDRRRVVLRHRGARRAARSSPTGAASRSPPTSSPSSTTRPTPAGRRPPRSTPRASPPAATCSSSAAWSTGSCTTATRPVRSARSRPGRPSAPGFKSTPGAGTQSLSLLAGRPRRRQTSSPRSATASTSPRSRASTRA